jgi:hypothetical protein
MAAMIELSSEIVSELRSMASEGMQVPAMLRMVLARLSSNQPSTILLILYMREAFHVPLKAVTPIGGWCQDVTGEITDDRLEEFVRPEIDKTRGLWEQGLPGELR